MTRTTLICGGLASSSRVLASSRVRRPRPSRPSSNPGIPAQSAAARMSDGNAAAKVMYGPLSDAAATLSRHRVSEHKREREDTTGIPGGEREVDASRSIWTSTNLGQLPRRSPSHPRKYAGAHSPDPKAPPPRLGRAMVRTPLDYLQPLLRGHSHSRVGKEEEEKGAALSLSLSRTISYLALTLTLHR